MRNVTNAPDRIGDDGKWMMSWAGSDPKGRAQFHSSASVLWQNILKRCDPSGSYQARNKSYAGVTNEFESFNSFAGWCQSQFGYGSIEGGKRWHLDKDLLASGRRSYSPDTCVFIPQRMNSLISNAGNHRSNDLPVGVYSCGARFFSRISNGYGKNLYLGMFNKASEASAAYREAKSLLLIEALEKSGHPDLRVIDAVQKLSDQIKIVED